ncbi:MAG: hypothetical protein HY721_34015 [Planctomycetes bacterium]|nr:hypothetical protein [Planctomycetota bacterium]
MRGNATLPVREESSLLSPGQVLLSYQWTYAEARHLYRRTERVHAQEEATDFRVIQNEHTGGIEVGLLEHLSAVLEVPFVYNKRSTNGESFAGANVTGRIVGTPAGLADIRGLLRYWVLPEGTLPGNIALEAGVKAPTGDKKTTFTHNGKTLNNDYTVQPGTGSWDGIFGAALFLRFGPLVPFANGRYLWTPEEDSGVRSFRATVRNTNEVNSVPDQATWRVGCALEAGRLIREAARQEPLGVLDRLSLSVALAGTHVPEHDIIGESDGFRRAHDALYIEPGIQWGPTSTFALYANVPISIYRYFPVIASGHPEVQVSIGMIFSLN